MRFNLGRPILVMLVAAAVSGGVVVLRQQPSRADLTFWTFGDSHAEAYRRLTPEFTRDTGWSVDVQLIPPAALNTRLNALFMAGQAADQTPDGVELQMGTAGPYFRPPVDEVGLLPLNRYLESTGFREIPTPAAPGKDGWHARCLSDGRIYAFRDGHWTPDPTRTRPDAWIDRIVQSRFAPWSKGGVIFGVPHDVHPVTITYREDLFREAGVDLASARTWAEFQDKSLAFQAYWRGRTDAAHPQGHRRYAIELFENVPDQLVLMLLQRNVHLIDADGWLHLTDPKVRDTLCFYAQLVAGPRKIAADAGGGAWARDLAEGYLCAALTADWRVYDVRRFAPTLAGKLRMMPLPRFDEGDAPTSTWDGTTAGIPRAARNPDAAWQLIERLYLGEAGVEERFRETGILPPLRDAWDHPVFHEPDPMYGGQRTGELFIALADHVPARHTTWATPLATQALGYVLYQARTYVAAGGAIDTLPEYVDAQLRRAEGYVRRGIEHGTFPSEGTSAARPAPDGRP